MTLPRDAMLLRIFIGEDDKTRDRRPLYEAIVLKAREASLGRRIEPAASPLASLAVGTLPASSSLWPVAGRLRQIPVAQSHAASALWNSSAITPLSHRLP